MFIHFGASETVFQQKQKIIAVMMEHLLPFNFKLQPGYIQQPGNCEKERHSFSVATYHCHREPPSRTP